MKKITTTILAIIFIAFQANAQCNMACNNFVQLSLSETGSAWVTWDMILEGGPGQCDPDLFEVRLEDKNGVILDNPIVNRSHIGDTLTATIIHTLDGVSCWGQILVEDKLNLSCSTASNFIIETEDQGDMVFADFIVYDFDDMASIQFSINYDTDHLAFNQFEQANLIGLDANSLFESEPGKIRMLWFEPSAQSASVPDSTVLFQLSFNKLSDGNSHIQITGNPLSIEMTNALGEEVCINAEPDLFVVDVDDDCTLSCYSTLTANLSANNTLEVFVQDFLDGDHNNCDVNNFELTLTDENNTVISNTGSVSVTEPGEYDYTIEDPITNIQCGGLFIVNGQQGGDCTYTCKAGLTTQLSNNDDLVIYVQDFLDNVDSNCDVNNFELTLTSGSGFSQLSAGSILVTVPGEFDFQVNDPSTNLQCNGTLTVLGNQAGDCLLVCNSLVNLSLDNNGEATVTIDMVLEGGSINCDPNFLELSLTDENGLVIDPPVATQAHVGQYLNTTITDSQSGNSCWGQVLVADFGCTLNCINLSTAIMNNQNLVTLYASDFLITDPNCDYDQLSMTVTDDLGIIYSGFNDVSIDKPGDYDVVITDNNSGQTCSTTLRVVGSNEQDCVDTMSIELVAEQIGDELIVDLISTNFNNIQTAQFSLEFDPAVLAYKDIESVLPGFTNGNVNDLNSGKLGLVWYDFTGNTPYTNPDGQMVFRFIFTALSNANSELGITNNPVDIEFTNSNEEYVCLSSESINVNVSGNVVPCIIACNDQVYVNIANGSNIVVTPSMVLEGGPYNACGPFELEIQDQDGNAIPTSPAISFTDEGETFLYTVTQVSTGASCWGYITAVKNTNENCVDSVYIDIKSSFDGERVRVDLIGYQFEQIIGIQYALKFDPSVLEFDEFISSPLPGFTLASTNVIGGDLLVSWVDPSLASISLQDGKSIMSFYFKALKNDNTTLSIGASPNLEVEIINSDLNFLCLNQQASTVVVDGAHYYGYVIFDENLDCIRDNSEQGLEDWFITLDNGTDVYNFDTDENGYYSMVIPAGNYTLTAHAPNDLWTFCENDIVAVTMSDEEFFSYDFMAIPQEDCPYMTVDLSTPFLRRCFDNNYYVSYCNKGTLTAIDSRVVVELDSELDFVSTDFSNYTINGQELEFSLGDVPIGECGVFKIRVNVNCDAELGETHCTEASVLPIPNCLGPISSWAGAVLEVSGTCENDSVNFTIKNSGQGLMTEASSFIVIEDDVMFPAKDVLLLPGEEDKLTYPANGSTYRIMGYQDENYPGRDLPTLAIEGCGFDNQGNFSTGFVNMFENGDGNEYKDIDCQENIGSFDPNDKASFPKGYRETHLINNDTELEYKLRFQNTGTDTAFRVVIKDTLSEYLDLISIELGSSSHPYTFSLEDSRILVFSFEDIQLVSKDEDELLSNGFVKYKIRQIEGNPDGTKILNKADIYFDFNPPVLTNETDHLIGTDFVETSVQTVNIEDPNLDLNIYPNPFVDQTNFELENIQLKNAQIHVHNILGMQIKTVPVKAKNTQINLNGVPSGSYIFRLVNDGKIIATGKIIRK